MDIETWRTTVHGVGKELDMIEILLKEKNSPAVL